VLARIIKRDNDDINREEGALIPAKDSIIIDTTNLKLEETVSFCLQKIKTKINQKL